MQGFGIVKFMLGKILLHGKEVYPLSHIAQNLLINIKKGFEHGTIINAQIANNHRTTKNSVFIPFTTINKPVASKTKMENISIILTVNKSK